MASQVMMMMMMMIYKSHQMGYYRTRHSIHMHVYSSMHYLDEIWTVEEGRCMEWGPLRELNVLYVFSPDDLLCPCHKQSLHLLLAFLALWSNIQVHLTYRIKVSIYLSIYLPRYLFIILNICTCPSWLQSASIIQDSGWTRTRWRWNWNEYR